MYSGRLSLYGDLLQGLFREAYALQKCLMELLDTISLDSSASEEEISDIVTGVFLNSILTDEFNSEYSLSVCLTLRN